MQQRNVRLVSSSSSSTLHCGAWSSFCFHQRTSLLRQENHSLCRRHPSTRVVRERVGGRHKRNMWRTRSLKSRGKFAARAITGMHIRIMVSNATQVGSETTTRRWDHYTQEFQLWPVAHLECRRVDNKLRPYLRRSRSTIHDAPCALQPSARARQGSYRDVHASTLAGGTQSLHLAAEPAAPTIRGMPSKRSSHCVHFSKHRTSSGRRSRSSSNSRAADATQASRTYNRRSTWHNHRHNRRKSNEVSPQTAWGEQQSNRLNLRGFDNIETFSGGEAQWQNWQLRHGGKC